MESEKKTIGRPKKESLKVSLSVYIEPELNERLKINAAKERRSVNSHINYIIEKYLSENAWGSEAFGISESAAKKHLAEIRNPECKTASGNTLKARQNAQERSGRTQKGGQGQSLDEAKKRTKAYLNDIKKMNLTGAEKEIILDLINKFLK